MENQDNSQLDDDKEQIQIQEDVKVSKNLLQRIISGIILMAVALAVIAAGDWLFTFFVFAVGVLMAYEWQHMVLDSAKARTSGDELMRWTFSGVAYIAIPCASVVALRLEKEGLALVLWMCFVVWATDIFAYTVGRIVGGPKIAPSISPKKTWSGLLGGVIGAIFVGVMANLGAPKLSFSAIIGLSAVLAVISQAGDFAESYIKRYFGAKDSGTLIPGHGGFLDRVDGMVPVAPLVLVIHKLFPIF